MSTPATQKNLDLFYNTLTEIYRELFSDPEYAYVAKRTTPDDLARKMVLGLDNGTANKDGKAIKIACRKFGIAHTYKAIRQFLQAE
jgi:hypothetical protein